MPRIAEMKHIDGELWVRISIGPNEPEPDPVMLLTTKEADDLRIAGVRDFLIDLWTEWRSKQ